MAADHLLLLLLPCEVFESTSVGLVRALRQILESTRNGLRNPLYGTRHPYVGGPLLLDGL